MTKKILVVDDERDILYLIKDILEMKGYSITTAVDGMDALEKIGYEKFDLYILDVFMPNLNGLELMRKIKEKYPLAVIIISTGYSSVEGAINAVRNGAFHYITKPIKAEELFTIVKKGLQHHDDLNLNSGEDTRNEDVSLTNAFDKIMLRGFTDEDRTYFHDIGVISKYQANEPVDIQIYKGAIIIVESGEIAVRIGKIIVEKLTAGNSWGEETFLPLNKSFTNLFSITESNIRIYSRKKIMEYFDFKGEALLKRFMINLTNMLYWKWKVALNKTAQYMGYIPQYKV